jgi:hypothetical protein
MRLVIKHYCLLVHRLTALSMHAQQAWSISSNYSALEAVELVIIETYTVSSCQNSFRARFGGSAGLFTVCTDESEQLWHESCWKFAVHQTGVDHVPLRNRVSLSLGHLAASK